MALLWAFTAGIYCFWQRTSSFQYKLILASIPSVLKLATSACRHYAWFGFMLRYRYRCSWVHQSPSPKPSNTIVGFVTGYSFKSGRMSHAVFETCNGIDFRPRVLLTLMQNAIHALYIFLFASDMATCWSVFLWLLKRRMKLF